MQNTLAYYDKNAIEFTESTRIVDFSAIQSKFLRLLPKEALILDFGCGSGRDTKAFLDSGYQVEAVDGSKELCKLATEYTGITVKQMLFEELAEVARYDGVWACSSILHLPYMELVQVIKKIATALKPDGYLYTSFKYSEFEGERNGRYFTDMTEEKLIKLLNETECFTIHQLWTTGDVRVGRNEEKWLNVILKKK